MTLRCINTAPNFLDIFQRDFMNDLKYSFLYFCNISFISLEEKAFDIYSYTDNYWRLPGITQQKNLVKDLAGLIDGWDSFDCSMFLLLLYLQL